MKRKLGRALRSAPPMRTAWADLRLEAERQPYLRCSRSWPVSRSVRNNGLSVNRHWKGLNCMPEPVSWSAPRNGALDLRPRPKRRFAPQSAMLPRRSDLQSGTDPRPTLRQRARPRAFVATLLWFLVAWSPVEAASHTTATLLLSQASARPGDTLWAGIHLKMDPGWHTYWRNPGESGAPTTVTWKMPNVVGAGGILWPIPETHEAGGLTTYVYTDEVTLIVPLTIASNAPPGDVELSADLRWLECEKVCVPGRGTVTGRITIGPVPLDGSGRAQIERARQRLPQIAGTNFVRAWWEGPPAADKRRVILEWPAQGAGTTPDFFSFEADTFTVGPVTEPVATDSGHHRIRATVERIGSEWPAGLAGLVVERGAAPAQGIAGAHEITVALLDGPPTSPGANSTPAVAGPPGADVTSAESEPSAGEGVSLKVLLAKLALAFVGGLILNLMPCVLPVIALKILGFVNQSHGSPAEARKLGLIYGAGVLASLLVLAGLVIAVNSAGKAASWGMQFQNPLFVVAITTLVTLVALNLFGVFEVTLGAGAMGKAGDLSAREGAAGAFFNGVLAVVLATPCSAPFLGIAIGFAVHQPAHLIVLVFSTVAIGLAFPYVLLSFFPQFLRFLPKPGAWMERFKNAMGFPMVATALWLLTLTAAHYGTDGILWVGLFLVLVSLAAWTWGQFVQRGRRRKILAGAFAFGFLLLGYAGVLEGQLHWRTPRAVARGGLKHDPDGIDWQPWSAQAVAAARQAGRPVFIDFTADWCITCQVNKRTSIEIDAVRRRLKEMNAVALLGDFTAEDEAIANELRRHGRAAVPLVLVYPKDARQPALVLPEALTPAIVLDALDKAAR